jgi:hypothetical protein
MSLTDDDLGKIKALFSGVAMKSDLELFATKSDLEALATKADLYKMESRLTTGMGLLERDLSARIDQLDLRIARPEKRR